MSTPAFWPFPMPVKTPLGEGYILYSVAQPLYENDTHLVCLDDGRLLHFSSNQLQAVPNGTYAIAPKAVPEPAGTIGTTLPRHVSGVTHRYAIRHDGPQSLCGKMGDDIVLISGDGYTCSKCREG